MNISPELIKATIVLVWVAICAVFDHKFHEVPTPLTLTATIIALLALIIGKSYFLAGYVIALYFVGDISKKHLSIILAVLISALAMIAMIKTGYGVDVALQPAFILLFWIMWKLEKIGGADLNIWIVITLILGIAPATFMLVVGSVVALAASIVKRVRHTSEIKAVPMIVYYSIGLTAYYLVHFWIGGII
jgi:energy-converting hydrogenase Eha subunit B